jgi:transcriptional regulator with XRE-family HTH domain
VSDELATGRRMKVARVASDLDPEAVAAALGISRRTYDRIEAGERPATRAELIVFSNLTSQDPSFFGVTSSSTERAILSDLDPVVNEGDDE